MLVRATRLFLSGRAERHGFENYRHVTLSLSAALETSIGEVHGKTASRHTRAEFVAFLENLVAHAPTGHDIHLIVNPSTHEKQRRGKICDLDRAGAIKASAR